MGELRVLLPLSVLSRLLGLSAAAALLQDQDSMAGELIRGAGAGAGLPAPLQGHRICGEELSGGACGML